MEQKNKEIERGSLSRYPVITKKNGCMIIKGGSMLSRTPGLLTPSNSNRLHCLEIKDHSLTRSSKEKVPEEVEATKSAEIYIDAVDDKVEGIGSGGQESQVRLL